MERLLNIWKERSLYRADFIQQLKLAIEDSNSPRPSGEINHFVTPVHEYIQYLLLVSDTTEFGFDLKPSRARITDIQIYHIQSFDYINLEIAEW